MLLPNSRIAEPLQPFHHSLHKKNQKPRETSLKAQRSPLFPSLRTIAASQSTLPQPGRATGALADALKPLGTTPAAQQFRGSLTSRDRRLRSAGSYMDEYRLGIAPGTHQVEITLAASRFLPRVQLLDPGEQVINQDSGKPARLSLTIQNPGQNPGTYRLRVLSDRPRQVGRYQLRYQVTPLESGRILNRDKPAFNSLSGYGLVNAAAAVARAIGQPEFPDVEFDQGGTVSGQAYFWGLDQTQVPEVWARGYRGQGVTIAIVDDGINSTHPALRNRLWTNGGELAGNGVDDDRNGYVDDVQGWNFVDNNSNVQPTSSDPSHGTFIAGVIAGQPVSGSIFPAEAQQRILGVAPDARLMAVKVMSDLTQNRTDRVAQGIRYAVDNGARIVNLSLGFGDGASLFAAPDVAIDSALQYARQRGVLVVMAAGNERQQGAVRPSQPAFGAARDLGIAVGAVDRSGILAAFSNPAGDQAIDYVTAPGVDIFSTYSSIQQQSHSVSSGTSFAAPYVSGIAALMLSANPSLTPTQIEQILTETAGGA